MDIKLIRPTWAQKNDLLKQYYDTEYGQPITDERELFERISLEVFQSGLSWLTILHKRDALRSAFLDFDPDIVSEFSEIQVEQLMHNEKIVRNRKKILATIQNAKATVVLRKTEGLVDFVWSFQRLVSEADAKNVINESVTQCSSSVALAKALQNRGFTMVGPKNIYAFMLAAGIISSPN